MVRIKRLSSDNAVVSSHLLITRPVAIAGIQHNNEYGWKKRSVTIGKRRRRKKQIAHGTYWLILLSIVFGCSGSPHFTRCNMFNKRPNNSENFSAKFSRASRTGPNSTLGMVWAVEKFTANRRMGHICLHHHRTFSSSLSLSLSSFFLFSFCFGFFCSACQHFSNWQKICNIFNQIQRHLARSHCYWTNFHSIVVAAAGRVRSLPLFLHLFSIQWSPRIHYMADVECCSHNITTIYLYILFVSFYADCPSDSSLDHDYTI